MLLQQLVTRYANVFATEKIDTGFIDKVTHNIEVMYNTSIKQPYIPPLFYKEVQDHLQGLLDKQIIKPSASCWTSPIVLVRNKYGTLRMCVPHRTILKTKKDAYLLPRVDETYQAVHNYYQY